MEQHNFFYEAERLFLSQDHDTLQAEDFFGNKKFALVIDLRSFNDNDVAGNGKKIINTQSGVLLEITKEAVSADGYCSIYVVSDGMVNITN